MLGFFGVVGRRTIRPAVNKTESNADRTIQIEKWLRRSGSQFDVVHVHGLLNPLSTLAARRCVRNRWPVVIRPFGTMSHYTFTHRRGALKQAYRRALDGPNLERASALHFTTSAERDESKWQGLDLTERAFVIPPPWLDEEASPFRSARDYSESVLFLARLHPVKSVELLLQAWPSIQTMVPGVRLAIAGDGPASYLRDLQTRARPLGDSVTFTGFVEGTAKRQLLEGAGVFVLPSLHENFGISVLEAIAAGLPVVITPEVQLSQFVREHALGIVVERSPDSLAEGVVTAMRDSALRYRCRHQGAALVARYFSKSAIGQHLLEMYRYAIAHAPA